MRFKRLAPALVVALGVTACAAGPDSTPTTTIASTDTPQSSSSSTSSTTSTVSNDDDVLGIVRNGTLLDDWQDYGWASSFDADGTVSVDFGGYGGWIVAQPELDEQFARVRLTFEAPESLGIEFLSVQVSDDTDSSFPQVVPILERVSTSVSGELSVSDLDPTGVGFDRLVLTATNEFPTPSTVDIIDLALIRGTPEPVGTTPASSAPAPSDVAARAAISCAAGTSPISPHIYGINQEFGNMPDEDWSIGATSRRWGGNATSRYNWRTGDWNTALDYYFRNVSDDDADTGDGRPHVEFLDENRRNGLSSAVTVPLTGWVAKDDLSASFPASVVGAQPDTDPFNPDFGNGVGSNGELIEPLAPTTTSRRFTPDDVGAWVAEMNADDTRPFLYYLDNEPMLWNSTHRDISPDPVGYDELLERTIAYATAVRAAQPDALIGGPSVWGWPAYFYSAIDADAGFDAAPDRKAHSGEPLIEWYLAELQAHEERTGVRLLDVLDVHFYPQDGSYSDAVDDSAVARRLRTTRSLWDSTYLEESWIEDEVALIPRMQAWVDEHAPGTLLSIGEYSFGAEQHISGGLAQAEALGRFGQFGLFAAYYWDVPPTNSPVYWAFRAFQNYDGAGSTFGDLSIPAESDRPVSLFASTTTEGDRDVAVVLNLSPDPLPGYGIDVSECGRDTVEAFQYSTGSPGLAPAGADISDGMLGIDLPGYSITVLELT
ncbi:MAG: glycoside hydrolase family 44 protein [Ilumatobacter sp.]